MTTTFEHLMHLGNKVYEITELACPFCSSPIYCQVGTPLGKVHIVCGNPDCTAQATSNDIEQALNILELVREDLLIERDNQAFNAEFPHGDSNPE